MAPTWAGPGLFYFNPSSFGGIKTQVSYIFIFQHQDFPVVSRMLYQSGSNHHL